MDKMVFVAIITGVFTLANGPLVIGLLTKKSKQSKDIQEIISEQRRFFHLLNRISKGLAIGLQNDKVIFKAFRENSINGDSEEQEIIMDEYFTECTFESFKLGSED